MSDGTIHERIRIILADQLRYEHTAEIEGWTPEQQVTSGAFVTWAALKRLHLYDGAFDQFRGADGIPAECLDLEVEFETLDPTQAAPTPAA